MNEKQYVESLLCVRKPWMGRLLGIYGIDSETPSGDVLGLELASSCGQAGPPQWRNKDTNL